MCVVFSYFKFFVGGWKGWGGEGAEFSLNWFYKKTENVLVAQLFPVPISCICLVNASWLFGIYNEMVMF